MVLCTRQRETYRKVRDKKETQSVDGSIINNDKGSGKMMGGCGKNENAIGVKEKEKDKKKREKQEVMNETVEDNLKILKIVKKIKDESGEMK